MAEDFQVKGQVSREKSIGNLKIALIITAAYMLLEAIGGWFANSLALMADAGHMLTDVAALSLALFAFRISRRPANARKTFGYHRLEILAAFINGISLAVISIYIIHEAYERFSSPPEVKGLEMMVIAFGGLGVNAAAIWLLHSGHGHNLNLRGAWLHVVGDALGSLVAIAAGLMVFFFGWVWADALSSVVISLIIIYGAWALIRESANVLLEGTPSHIEFHMVQNAIEEMEGVIGVHDLHIWTITSGKHSLSAHVVYENGLDPCRMLKRIRKKIEQEFRISHLTIQMETEAFEQSEELTCDSSMIFQG